MPGTSTAEGTHVTDVSAFYCPSGLAIAPEPGALALGAAASLALSRLAPRAARHRVAQPPPSAPLAASSSIRASS